jgi:hypothetical protein
MSPIFLINQRCFNPNKSILKNSGSFLSSFKYILLFLFLFSASLIEGQTTVTYNVSGTYSFTVPSGVSSVTVQCWGAGGAGGGVTSNGIYGGAGGAGGAYASKIVSVTAGTTYLINVGAGGIGGTGNGPSGGDSWFSSSSTVIAKGGNGGGGNNGSPGIGTTSGSIGSTVYKGGDGIDGYYYFGSGGGGAGSTGNGGSVLTSSSWSGGSGTSVGGGNGGDGLYYTGNGNPGLGAGGGGSGAFTANNTHYSGGNGADGQVVITYYLSLPTITSFTPSGGCANSTTVVITGTNFTGATAVTFGGTNAASFTVNSATQITATIGAGTTGAIIVTTPSGNATSASNFTFSSPPTLTGVSICQGSTGSLTASTSCLSGGLFTVGPNDAGTGATGGGSGYAWSNTGRVTANDNNYANSSINKNKFSEALNATNYGFSIPSNAIINGVEVAIGRYGSGSNSLQDNSVKLIVGGSTQGNNNGDQSTFWPTSGTPANYGSTSDLWGNSLTPAQINDPNFGVALVVDNNNNSGSRTAHVDYIEVTVTYTIPGSLDWYTVSSGGSSIGSGSPFNPVGVSGSGLANTNTAGTTVFYAECSSAPGCRASTNFTINSTPSVSSATTPTCVGGSTGTINVTASGGGTPYTYSLNGGTYQTSSLFTGLAAGTYTLNVKNSTGCVASSSVLISSYPNSTDNQNATGTDSWIGHMYSGMNFQNYIGHFTETETFDEGFGGNYTCFDVISNSATSSIYTEQFSVRFKMNSTRQGLYVVDLGSDDGSRLTVDGTLIYNNWVDQSFSTRSRILMNLTGNSSLNYEFYENAINNRVIFQNLTLVLANSLTTNTTQTICLGSNGSVISGDSFGALPSGISLSGTGYQWSYSVTPGGTRTNITGATSATYIPNTSAAPFNVPGTYYIYRKAILSSSNNTGVNPYVATNESNAATITVNALPAITAQPSTSTQTLCYNDAATQLSVMASGIGLSYQWYSNTTNSNSGGTLLSGSTSSTYNPVTTTAGTLYYYVKVSGTCTPAVTSNVSGAVTVSATPSATISYAGSPFCYNTGNAGITFSGTTGGTYSITPAGANINSVNGKVNLASSTPGTYTVTYTVAAAGGCSLYTTSTQIVINPNTWIGNSNSNWNNSGNWAATYTTGCPDVTILGGVPYQPLLNSGTISINNLIINSGANLTLTNATLQISGTISNSGTFDASAGTLEMNGSSAQTIAGSMFANKTINNLIVSNTGTGLSVSSAANDTLKITGALTFGNSGSTLNTGDNIDLVSDINATANVGIVNPGNTITGKVIAERYIPTGISHGKSWQFLAAPTNSQTIKESWMEGGVTTTTPTGYGSWITGTTGTAGGFDASSAAPAMKTYSPATDSWITVGNPTTTPIHNDNGYMIFVRGDRSVVNAFGANSAAVPTNLRAKGTLLTGTLPAINVPAGKYQSIGNPYASRIEFSKISKNNVDDVFYVWDPLLYGYYGYGGYQTLSGTNNYQPTAPNGGTANYQLGVSYPYIESGQAFFVHNSSGTDGTVTFTENVKATGTLLVNRPGSVLTQRQFFRVYLYTNAGLIADGNAVAFDNNFANTIDGNDALKITNSGENFGIKRAGKILAVEARSPVEASDTIYYNLSNFGRKTYQLHFAPENMRGSGLSAYLIDKYLKTSTPVNLDDTSTVAITVNADAASSAADRLMVVFSPMTALPVTFTSVKAYQEGKDIAVEWNVENESNMQQYEVEKSSDGNSFTKVATIAAINGVANNYHWLDQQILPGYNYYRIRSVDINGKTNYTQVVKVLVGKSGSEIRVYPNPIINGTINLQLTNQPPGIYEIKLINPLGQEIISKKIIHTGGNIIETIELNSGSAKGVYQLKVIKPDGSEKVNKVLN